MTARSSKVLVAALATGLFSVATQVRAEDHPAAAPSVAPAKDGDASAKADGHAKPHGKKAKKHDKNECKGKDACKGKDECKGKDGCGGKDDAAQKAGE